MISETFLGEENYCQLYTQTFQGTICIFSCVNHRKYKAFMVGNYMYPMDDIWDAFFRRRGWTYALSFFFWTWIERRQGFLFHSRNVNPMVFCWSTSGQMIGTNGPVGHGKMVLLWCLPKPSHSKQQKRATEIQWTSHPIWEDGAITSHWQNVTLKGS